MSLEKWAEYGWLRAEPTSPDEIRGLMEIVSRDRPMPGHPVILALAQLEDGSIESVAKKDGVVIDRWTRKLTDDRNVFLIYQRVIDSAGNKITNSALYRRTSN